MTPYTYYVTVATLSQNTKYIINVLAKEFKRFLSCKIYGDG